MHCEARTVLYNLNFGRPLLVEFTDETSQIGISHQDNASKTDNSRLLGS